jgi:alanyl-tRNA synthetase
MRSQEIRETFLDFFGRRSHKILPSSLLLPKDDPTILFTNAGMNQFKNVFLGLETRSYKRAATVQKCMRVSGKHNDLEQVGRTAKHHTFFEMLGNFSFGDYFKRGAVAYAWELMTGVFKLSKDRLYITVYEEDDEAFRIWNAEAGVPSERIFSFGKKDNFWAMGESGPCGPCSEIHYDFNPGFERGSPRDLIEQGSDRFAELWNLVFMQFFQDEQGVLHPLPSPSIDTGMGLERMAASLQGKTSNFETDLFSPLIREICALATREYPARDEGDVSVRLIADHARAIAFLIGDGIMPANDGRGYVLRRLIRRAFRHGNLIGIEEPFVFKLAGVVSDVMKDAYPELLASLNFISKICYGEEERFARTLSSGLKVFYQYVQESRQTGSSKLSGKALFKLYDTFGFPLDLSQELAQEKHMAVDEKGFEDELLRQQERARRSWKGDEKQKEKKVYAEVKDIRVRFVGYDEERTSESTVLALFKDGARAEELQAGDEGEGVLDVTPFYAEAGGQVGDAGIWKNPRAAVLVENAFYPIPEIISHKIKVLSGSLRRGDRVEALIDAPRRTSIRNNHTATHLLNAALRQVLGDHVKQAGSLVSPWRLRFDFTHFAPVSAEEMRKIETLVNEKIRENLAVHTQVVTLEEGLREGAMAIFEEKYGEKVRMVVVGDFSKELCGGVHAHATGEIGLFKVVAETSVAAGMRRIEAVTSEEALKFIQETESLVEKVIHLLSTSRHEVAGHIEKLIETGRRREHEIKSLRQQLLMARFEKPEAAVRSVKGISVWVQRVEGVDLSEMRELADSLKQRIRSGVVFLGAAEGEKAFLVVAVTKDLTARISAAEIIKKLAPLIGGGGGGRPDFAQAGGTKTGRVEKALETGVEIIEELL